jgi:hypothetical protein
MESGGKKAQGEASDIIFKIAVSQSVPDSRDLLANLISPPPP